MRVVLVPQARDLFPFARKPDDCALGAETFGAYRARTLADLGLSSTIAPDAAALIEGPALVMADDVFATKRAIRLFVRAMRGESAPCRMSLPPSRMLELFLPLQDVPVAEDGRVAFDVAFVPAGMQASVAALFSLEPERWRSPAFREIPLEVPMPPYILGRESRTFSFPLTSCVAMRIRHWVHVLRANHLMPQILLIENAERHPVKALFRTFRSLRFSKPGWIQALKSNFVETGKNCFIHPTAIVESSVLGDNVQVGAHAYIVGSVLGNNVHVEQRAHIEQSCLGAHTYVSKNSTVSACVSFGDTDVCTNGIQGSAIAERCALTSWARPLDVVPGGEVSVRDEEQIRSVGEMPCGVAFGSDVFVGADVNIAPGRAIPPGIRLIADPRHTLRKIPKDTPAGRYAVENGTVLAFETLKNDM